MREFGIVASVRKVAAGGHVEIMHRDRIAQSRPLSQHRGDVPAISLAAERFDVEALERQSREHDYPVVALLPVESGVLVAQPLETLERKPIVRTFRLLQAEHVRPHRLHEFRHSLDAQSHRVDVPGGEGEAHTRNQGSVDQASGNRGRPDL